MISKLIDFALMALYILVFKVCGIIGISEIEFFNFSSTERIKCNQGIKFGQLIEYNMRNIFLEKSCTKYGGNTTPRSFSKKSKLSISLNQ